MESNWFEITVDTRIELPRITLRGFVYVTDSNGNLIASEPKQN